jgi:MFS family permease
MKNDATIIGVVGLAHALSHFFQLAFAPLFPMIREELGISYSTIGVVVMLFFAASAILQPLAGFLVDRIGGRGVLMSGVALMVLGAVIMSAAQGAGVLALGAVVMGVGNCVFHPADFSILNARVSQPRLGYAFSAHGFAGSLGFAAAPTFSAVLASAYGWRAALLAAAAAGCVILIVLLANAHLLGGRPAAKKQQAMAQDARVLLAPPVLLCFVFFLIWGGSYAGLSNFSITAMKLQFDVSETFAGFAITAYMLGSAGGMLAGGYVATRFPRHDVVAGAGLSVTGFLMLAIATGAVPAGGLPLAFALAGLAAGVTYPSRDLIVRGATPPGAAGRVYGFVYSGLDLGAVVTPVFYGMLIDAGVPQGVFYVIFAFTAVAILTVLQVPGRRAAIETNAFAQRRK